MKKKGTYFIVGIPTEVGETIVPAIPTETLEADYWKPIQSGDLENSNIDKVRRLTSNTCTAFRSDSYALHTSAGPHLSAELDGIRIGLSKIVYPETDNYLVIEAAGEPFVPLNEDDTVLGLFRPIDKIVLVSCRYLGNISHTLLAYEALEHKDLDVYDIIFSGISNPPTESFILHEIQLSVPLHISEEPYFDRNAIAEYAGEFGN